jgi:hypothetical protein
MNTKQMFLKLAGQFSIIKNGIFVGECNNLITDYGLDVLGGSGGAYYILGGYAHTAISYMHLGSGTTIPNNTDTALAAFLASSNVATPGFDANSSSYADRIEVFRSVRFGAGVGTGTITELGMSNSATTGNLFCRALIKDSVGSPISVVKGPNDIIDIEYRLTMRPTLSDVTGTLNGRSFTLRPLGLNQVLNNLQTNWGLYNKDYSYLDVMANRTTAAYHSATLATTSSNTINGTLIGTFNSSAVLPYVNGSHTLHKNLTMLSTAGNHANGINGITFPLLFGYFQAVFDTPIMKTVSNTLNIGVSISWGR